MNFTTYHIAMTVFALAATSALALVAKLYLDYKQGAAPLFAYEVSLRINSFTEVVHRDYEKSAAAAHQKARRIRRELSNQLAFTALPVHAEVTHDFYRVQPGTAQAIERICFTQTPHFATA